MADSGERGFKGYGILAGELRKEVERTRRAEARLAEALNLLGEAVGFVGVRQPLDYDSEVEADQVRIRVENFLSREGEPE